MAGTAEAAADIVALEVVLPCNWAVHKWVIAGAASAFEPGTPKQLV